MKKARDAIAEKARSLALQNRIAVGPAACGMRNIWNRLALVAATGAVIGINAAANALPINGVTTGAVSARYPSGFTPAGWVFSIWGLIYVGLLAFSIFSARANAATSKRLAAVRGAYLVSCAANIAWIFAWHFDRIALSMLLMLVLLAAVLAVYIRLRRERPGSLAERLCVDVPFSLYAGWLTTAAIANLGVLLASIGRYPFDLDKDSWGLASLTAATAIYAAAGTRARDPVFTAVFVWAALGIAWQTMEVSAAVRVVAATAGAVSIGVTGAVLLSIARGRSNPEP
jgi:hypothetical protein